MPLSGIHDRLLFPRRISLSRPREVCRRFRAPISTLAVAVCLTAVALCSPGCAFAQSGGSALEAPAMQNQAGPSGLAAHDGSNVQPARQSGDSAASVATPPGSDTIAWDAAMSDSSQEDSPKDIPRYWPRPGRPTSQFQFDYYRDSGGTRVLTLTSLTDVSVGKATFTLRREKVAVRDPQGDEGSEATIVSGYGKPWKWLLVGGGIGVIRTQDGSSSLAGSLRSSVNVGTMSITLSAERGLVEGGTQTIRNHLMQTDFGVSIWDDITDHLGAEVEFHHGIFSDGTSENDFSFAPEYSIDVWKTKLALEWDFDYANFTTPTTLGYYAPGGLLSNQPAISWNFDRAGYYGLIKAGVMRSYDLYESKWSPGFSGTGVAALGKRLSERLALECYVTAGRDALGMPATWSSINTGFKLNYSFGRRKHS